MTERLPVKPAQTVVWRKCLDEKAHTFKAVALRCVCPVRRLPGMEAEFCPACRTYWIDEGWHLPDVRLVFAVGDAPPDAVYIGRKKAGMHFGNPFSHLKKSAAAVHVATLAEAIASCEAWLKGAAYPQVEPERREWILANLELLRDRPLSCHCAPPGGVNLTFRDCCHGQVYLRLLEAPKTATRSHRPLTPAAKRVQGVQTTIKVTSQITSQTMPQPEASKPQTASVLETQISLFPEAECLKTPKENYEIQPGAWHLPGFLNRQEQQDVLEWLRDHGGKRLEALKTPTGLDFSVKVASIGRKWVPYKYLDAEDEPFQFKLEVIAKNALNAIKTGICPDFVPDTAILNYYAPTAKLSLHQDDSEAAALIEAGSPIVTIALGMSCRARQGNCQDKNQPYHDFIFASGDAWVMSGESRSAFHGVMRILPDTQPPWLPMKSPGRLSLSIRQSR